MANPLDDVLSSIESNRQASVAGLSEFLRIPSVSTKPEHAGDVKRCAQWLSDQMQSRLVSMVVATDGHPIVLARSKPIAGVRTVLVYGHYDVQPAEPLDQWKSPAFEPTVRDGAIYARGAVDDKGQVWVYMQALAAWHKHGGVPLNVILLIEGEEEIGSGHLDKYVRENAATLKADLAVISDTNQFARGLPAITYGLRGLVYMEVIIDAVSHDLHSGMFGGAVPNPANVLCELLATLHDANGRVNIPGFYDDVLPLQAEEIQAWAKLPFDDRQFAADVGARGLSGEAGFTTLQRRWARPTCDINGLTCGYQGHGAKTIIPAVASAKVSMRLVANQNPAKIQAAFESALRQRSPDTVTMRFLHHGLAAPVLVPVEGPAMRCAARAIERGFGVPPVLMREGGSIPVVGLLKEALHLDTLLVGFGLPDDRVHSPNEKFDLDALHQGTRTAAALYEELARM